MRTLHDRLNKIEAALNDDGDCHCPSPPSPAPPPGMTVVEHRVISPPLRLRCRDCRRMRAVEFAISVLTPAGQGEGGP
jgi:hypothetical protein